MKRCIPVLLALCLVLTGCTSMLERQYLSIQPHTQFTSTTVSDNLFDVGNYQELLSVLLYFISTSSPSGSVGLHDYVGDVEHDLAAACLEVTTKDPLGSYAVEFIDYQVNRVVTYYDVNFEFNYRRTPEQIASIHTVVGSGAIRNAVVDTFTMFGSELVLRLDYFTEDEDYLQNLIAQAYYDAPQVAFGMPVATVRFYPDTEQQRVAELTFTYPASINALTIQADLLDSLTQSLIAPLVESSLSSDDLVASLYGLLVELLAISDQGLGTAYDALLGYEVDSEGAALTWQLLCQYLELESALVVGTQDGTPHFWNIVRIGDQWRHVDLATRCYLALDSDMVEQGYDWDIYTHPPCIA